MLRDKIFKSAGRTDPGNDAEHDFRTRGGEVKRIEGFSDAVFAFAITLLIISLEVPKTFDELVAVLRDFPAFALSCLMLLLVWRLHYNYFRRYGLEDAVTHSLNGLLLLVVLFFVYPLKFLFTALSHAVMGMGMNVALPNGGFEPMFTDAQTRPLMFIYGAGYIAVFGVFALLYQHAYNKRRELDLNGLEIALTRSGVIFDLVNAGIAVLSILIALVLPDTLAGWSGVAYMLVWPMQRLRHHIERRQRVAWLAAQASAENPAPADVPSSLDG